MICFYTKVLLAEELPGIPAVPQCILPECIFIMILTDIDRINTTTHPRVFSIDLSEMSEEMVGVDLDLPQHRAGLANQDLLVVQILRGIGAHLLSLLT